MSKATTAAEPGRALKLPVSVLAEDPDNARTISEGALAGLAISAETFGDLSGIVFNERSGHLVAGHQRMKVLRAAGAAEWTRRGDCGAIVHPKTKEEFRIRIVDWDEATERMANLVANNPAIQGEFTGEALDQLRDLEDEAGFEALRLDGLVAELEKELDREAKKAQRDAEAGAEDESNRLIQSFSIVIECESEAHQARLLDRFAAEGIKCRALI